MDQEAGELTLKARAGSFERPFPREKRVRKIEEVGIIDWVARYGRTLVANDVSQEPRYRPFLPHTRSELCVPIKDGERVVAGINIESDRLYAFDEADVAAFETLADELVVALRNARLFAEGQRRIAELAALNQVGRALVAPLHLDELIEVVYREVTAVMPADAFSIALYDREANELDYRIRVDMGMREPPERRPLEQGLTAEIGVLALLDPERRTVEVRAARGPEVAQSGTRFPLEELPAVCPVHTGELCSERHNCPIALENARLYEDVRGPSLAAIRALAAAIDARDPYTWGRDEWGLKTRESAGGNRDQTCR